MPQQATVVGDEGGLLQGPWTLAHYFVALVVVLHLIAVVRIDGSVGAPFT